MTIYNKVYDFCKVVNTKGLAYNNGEEPTERVEFIISLLNEYNIPYVLDTFKTDETSNNSYFNINLMGSPDCKRMVTAHHDIVNNKSENANDNSCSVINAIALKIQMPELHVVLLDGEEIGGKGSQRCSNLINSGHFGEIDWVLNLELTGVGGDKFFIGKNGGKINEHIKSLFNCPVIPTPYNDSITFNRNGIDSTVINPCPHDVLSDTYFDDELNKVLESVNTNRDSLTEDEISVLISDIKENTKMLFDDKYILHTDHLYLCHSVEDTLDKISVEDMENFVNNVLIKILKNG